MHYAILDNASSRLMEDDLKINRRHYMTQISCRRNVVVEAGYTAVRDAN